MTKATETTAVTDAAGKARRDAIELFDEAGNSRGFLDPRNVLNDLTGREWQFWTRSVITKPYPATGKTSVAHDLRREHGAEKPPHLCADLIRVFTKADEVVLDPFMGTGGTLLGAALAGRRAVGIDLEARWPELYDRVCEREGLTRFPTITGDARAVLDGSAEPEPPGLPPSVDLVLTDVPYWNMDKAPRSPGKWKRVGEASRERRKSKLSRFQAHAYPTKEIWRDEVAAVLLAAAARLREKRYLLAFVGDMYFDDAYHQLGAELASAVAAASPDLVLKASLVWYDVSKKLHIYGYRYAWIPSIIHQNVLVFRKQTGGPKPRKRSR